MRRNVDAPEIVWAALTLLTEELGYNSRQELTEAILTNFVDSYPGVKLMAADEAFRKMDAAEAKNDFEHARKIPKPSMDELKELLDPEDFQQIIGLTDGVKSQLASVRDETPELPDL